jgi:hypothetical protein
MKMYCTGILVGCLIGAASHLAALFFVWRELFLMRKGDAALSLTQIMSRRRRNRTRKRKL